MSDEEELEEIRRRKLEQLRMQAGQQQNAEQQQHEYETKKYEVMRKILSAEGRQNTLPVLHSLEQYALAFHMCVIHASEWPWVGVCGKGNEKGDVLKDSHAMKNAKN